MTIDLHVDDEAVELNATCSQVPLFALPDSTLTLMSGGYSTAGEDPGPKQFPEILDPEGGGE